MTLASKLQKLLRLPDFSLPIWILTVGRLLSQIGTGFTLFSAPIFFSGELGLSSSLIGFGLGMGSLAGVLGRLISGTLSDRPGWGRRPMLLWSAAIATLADLAFACSPLVPGKSWQLFMVGNLLMGFGIGLYWPAMEAALVDRTTPDQRNEAFALSRLGDNLGLGIGVLLGGALMVSKIPYPWLFVADGISFVVFGALVFGYVTETVGQTSAGSSVEKATGAAEPLTKGAGAPSGWKVALGDRTLQKFVLVNILFTAYLSQIHSTLPLFLSKFLPKANLSLSPGFIGSLFTLYVFLTAMTQMPVARFFRNRGHRVMLQASNVSWVTGFLVLATMGFAASQMPMVSAGMIQAWTLVSLIVLSLATVTYLPAASAFVAELAPDALRGTYLSINSQCWAIGYFLGPTIGGWALDQLQRQAYWLWAGVALCGLFVDVGLRSLGQSPAQSSS